MSCRSAATHPEIVDKLDLLITDYIRSTNVVVPLPNPKFDESVFNSQSIGVQPGGLKMPREFIRDQAPKKQLGGTTLIDSEKMLGWTIRGGSASITHEALQIKAESKQAFADQFRYKCRRCKRFENTNQNIQANHNNIAVESSGTRTFSGYRSKSLAGYKRGAVGRNER